MLWYSISCLLCYTIIPILASAVLLGDPWIVVARDTGVVDGGCPKTVGEEAVGEDPWEATALVIYR